jgi:cytochrome c553
VRFAGIGLALLELVTASTLAQPAPGPDAMAKRVLACTTCHGKEGRATSEGYFPRIAGKPAGYLYNQLVNFREGRRTYAPMTYLIDHLSDAYLLEIAQHFASLELPYPPPQTRGASPEVLARGRALVFDGVRDREIPACAQCHGKALTGVKPAVPGLLGLPRDYLNGQLGAWQTRQRHAAAPDCMAAIAGKLTTQEIDEISTFLSSQPVPADSRPASAHAGPLPITCGSIPR